MNFAHLEVALGQHWDLFGGQKCVSIFQSKPQHRMMRCKRLFHLLGSSPHIGTALAKHAMCIEIRSPTNGFPYKFVSKVPLIKSDRNIPTKLVSNGRQPVLQKHTST